MAIWTGTLGQLLAAQKITAAKLATWFSALTSITDTWTTFNPTWGSSGTAPTIGNGSVTGSYRQTGKSFDAVYTITVGSTTTAGTGNYSLSLPPGITLASGNQWEGLGVLWFRDTSGATTYGFDAGSISSASIGAASNSSRWGATTPIAIGTGDTIVVTISGNCA